MDPIDDRLAALLAVPETAPDIGFANEVAYRIAVERTLADRLAADRARTATLIVATCAVAAGLWLFARGSAFADAVGGSGGVGLAAVAAVMILWLGTAGAGALASD